MAAQHNSSLTADTVQMICTHLKYRFNCACVVKPVAGQTEQTWHSLVCAVETEGKTVHVWGPFKAYVCGRCIAGVLGSNAAGGMDVGVVCCKQSQKGKLQDNEGTETSTVEVKSTREYKKKTANGMDVFLCLCCVGSGLCDELISF
jgi:hypothetical protein